MRVDITQEHRRHRRVAAELPVRFALLSASEEPGSVLQGSTTTLSVGGVSFHSTQDIPIHSRLALEIPLPEGRDAVFAQGVVRRIRSHEGDPRGVEYGIEFDGVQHEEALSRFIVHIDLVPMLNAAVKEGAGTLHLSVGSPPMVRVRRRLAPLDDEPIDAESLEAMVVALLSTARRRELAEHHQVDFPLTVPEVGRWRVNVHYQRGMVEATFRSVDMYAPPLAELGHPAGVRALARTEQGLVLVSGPPGSGRSTTMASMVEAINAEDAKVIITLEDPIEFHHENRLCIIKQREVGTDVDSFAEGIRQAMRQDPDVLVVGDVPDQATLDLVLRAAETHRLVIAGFTAATSLEALNRIAVSYPREQRALILHLLGGALRGVVSQRLLPGMDGARFALAVEILGVNDAVRQAIRTGNLEQIPTLMLSAPGCQPLDVSLRNLIQRGLIDGETAAQAAGDPEAFRR